MCSTAAVCFDFSKVFCLTAHAGNATALLMASRNQLKLPGYVMQVPTQHSIPTPDSAQSAAALLGLLCSSDQCHLQQSHSAEYTLIYIRWCNFAVEGRLANAAHFAFKKAVHQLRLELSWPSSIAFTYLIKTRIELQTSS